MTSVMGWSTTNASFYFFLWLFSCLQTSKLSFVLFLDKILLHLLYVFFPMENPAHLGSQWYGVCDSHVTMNFVLSIIFIYLSFYYYLFCRFFRGQLLFDGSTIKSVLKPKLATFWQFLDSFFIHCKHMRLAGTIFQKHVIE